MSTLLVGTCSWKFPSWHPLVYSAADGIDHLAEYAGRYRTVEIDQWFWSYFGPGRVSLPSVETVAEYLAATDETFRFSIKAPNAVTLTHAYAKRGAGAQPANPHFLSAEMYGRFLERIAPMRKRTAVIMLQFEYLNRTKMPSLAAFVKHLDGFLCACNRSWPLAVEIRNTNYLKPELFRLLAKHRVGFVFCHGYYMPPAPEVYQNHFADGSAAAVLAPPDEHDPLPRSPAVIRLLGGDRSGIEAITKKRWDTIVAPKDDELASVAAMVTQMLEREVDVVVNVNNHYEGSAPLTIEKLERLISERYSRS